MGFVKDVSKVAYAELVGEVRSLEGGAEVLMRGGGRISELKRRLCELMLAGSSPTDEWHCLASMLARVVSMEEEVLQSAKLVHERDSLIRSAAGIKLGSQSHEALKRALARDTAQYLIVAATSWDWIMDDMRDDPHDEVIDSIIHDDYGGSIEDMIDNWISCCMPVSLIVSTRSLEPGEGHIVDEDISIKISEDFRTECVYYASSNLISPVTDHIMALYSSRMRSVVCITEQANTQLLQAAQRALACMVPMLGADEGVIRQYINQIEQ